MASNGGTRCRQLRWSRRASRIMQCATRRVPDGNSSRTRLRRWLYALGRNAGLTATRHAQCSRFRLRSQHRFLRPVHITPTQQSTPPETSPWRARESEQGSLVTNHAIRNKRVCGRQQLTHATPPSPARMGAGRSAGFTARGTHIVLVSASVGTVISGNLHASHQHTRAHTQKPARGDQQSDSLPSAALAPTRNTHHATRNETHLRTAKTHARSSVAGCT